MNPTQLTERLWHQVCALYALPHEAEISQLKSSGRLVYKITRLDGLVQVLRVYAQGINKTEAIQSEMSLLTYLSQNTDLVVPTPISNIHGCFVSTINEEGRNDPIHVIMLTFVEGEPVEKCITNEMMVRVGQILSQLDLGLHKADTEIIPVPSQTKKPFGEMKFISTPLSKLKNYRSNRNFLSKIWTNIKITHLADRLRRNYIAVKDLLPWQLLHTDAHLENFVFDGTRIGILDFSNFRFGPRIYELTPPLYFICEVEAGIRPNTYSSSMAQLKESLLAGYQDFIKLSDQELSVLPLFQAIHLFVVLGWSVFEPDSEDWFQQNSEKLMKYILRLLNSYEGKQVEIQKKYSSLLRQ